MTSDNDAILKVIRSREDAIARSDAKGALAHHAPDIVVYDLPPPLEYRGDAARDEAGLNAWFATWQDGVTVRLRDPQIVQSGDLAVVFGLSQMQGKKKADDPEAKLDKGDGADIWTRQTVVLRRGPDGWRIIHEHGSFPTMMDGSGLAATGLTPET